MKKIVRFCPPFWYKNRKNQIECISCRPNVIFKYINFSTLKSKTLGKYQILCYKLIQV